MNALFLLINLVKIFSLSPDATGYAQLLLGHCSLVTDMILSWDQNFLITSDRDEKIRVSRYPQTFDIHAFCLAHREYVTRILICGQNLLVSGSGDGSLVLWDWTLGKPLFSHKTDPMRVVWPAGFSVMHQVLAIIAETECTLTLFHLDANHGFKLLQVLQLACQPLDATFDVNGLLWVATTDCPLIQIYERKDGEILSPSSNAPTSCSS